MPKATPSSGGILSVRSKDLFIGTPGELAFENLITPDVYEGKKTFSETHHQNPAQLERLADLIDAEVDKLRTIFEAACEEEGRATPPGGWIWPDGRSWVADHLKDAGEKSRNKDPMIKFANAAEYLDKQTREPRMKTMRAYDSDHKVLDLPALRLGRGSIIQPVLIPGLYVTKVVKHPGLSFKLQGVVVIDLKQSGGGAGGSLSGRLSENDLVGLSGVQPMDLSQYAGGSTQQAASTPSNRVAHDPDLDDEIPF